MPPTNYIVYLADDDEDDLTILTNAFSDVDRTTEVRWYKTTAKLIRQLEALSSVALPDLIVMDHHMPPYGECELVRAIRSQKKLDPIALIIYTTVLQEKRKPAMLADGVDGILTKGLSFGEVKEHVAVFCGIVAGKKKAAAAQRKI